MDKKKYTYSYNKKCDVCNKDFTTNRYSTKICSKECVQKRLSESKKYSEESKRQAIELRLQGFCSTEIEEKTGIKKSSQTKLFKDNGIKLTDEQAAVARSRRWLGHEATQDGKKECSQCGELLDLDMFHINNNRLSGHTSACKNCSKEQYIENSEEIKQKVKEYKDQNKEQVKQWNSDYYLRNKGSKDGK